MQHVAGVFAVIREGERRARLFMILLSMTVRSDFSSSRHDVGAETRGSRPGVGLLIKFGVPCFVGRLPLEDMFWRDNEQSIFDIDQKS